MVRLMPSKIQPKISLRVSQMPSPSRINFFCEMGSSPVWPVAIGGGKIWWMAWSKARLWCRRTAGSVLCKRAQ